MTASTRLQAVRRVLEYKAAEVITLLIQRADVLGVAVMEEASLKTKLSRWENGHEQVSEPYRRLFRDVYGRTNEDLGFPVEDEDDETSDLRSRLAISRNVDAAAVDGFRQQIENARHTDQRFGGLPLLDQLHSIISHIERLLAHSTARGQREALASVLVEASTLAGWVSLDRNAVNQAWSHYERAKAAAREANSTAALAHALAEQAFVLIDIGETDHAAEQLDHARSLGNANVPALLQAWLAAATGEGFAATGQHSAALRAFDEAADLLPTDPNDPALPFLFLGGSHLDRWRGNVVAKLGEPSAVQNLTDALTRLPSGFVRARVAMQVDLAFAHAAAGDREQARLYQRQARQLGKQIRSDRHLRRLSSLILPTGSRPT